MTSHLLCELPSSTYKHWMRPRIFQIIVGTVLCCARCYRSTRSEQSLHCETQWIPMWRFVSRVLANRVSLSVGVLVLPVLLCDVPPLEQPCIIHLRNTRTLQCVHPSALLTARQPKYSHHCPHPPLEKARECLWVNPMRIPPMVFPILILTCVQHLL